MPDSDHWVQVFLSYKGILAVVRSIKHPSDRRIISLGLPKGTVHGFAGVGCSLLGAVDSVHVLASAGGSSFAHSEPAQIHLFTFAIVGPGAEVRPYEVSLPNEKSFSSLTWLMEAALSQSGNQLAWLVYNEPHYPNEAITFRSLSLMVSQVDGTHLRVIGSFPAHKYLSEGGLHPKDVLPMIANIDLTWLPDDQYVQIFLGRTLWRVRLPTDVVTARRGDDYYRAIAYGGQKKEGRHGGLPLRGP